MLRRDTKDNSERKSLHWAGITECTHKKKRQIKQKIDRINIKHKDKWTNNGKIDVKRGGQTDKQKFDKRARIFEVTRPYKLYKFL